MKRYFLVLVLTISYLISAEPSAFDAGRLDSKNPYGLTETEKFLLNTSNKVQNVTREVNSLKIEVEKIGTQQEGLKSVMDGISQKITLITKNAQAADENASADLAALKTQLKELQDYVNEGRNLELQNQENVKNILSNLTLMLDQNSAANAALEKRISALEAFKAEAKVIDSLKSVSPEDLMKEAERLFGEKDYEKAKPYFQELITRNHRPARCSFLLGEIAYFSSDWNDAIVQYKKSAELYDKAAYMPKLLYHTAISFDKLGDTASANQFYKLLKTNYADTAEAKASPKR